MSEDDPLAFTSPEEFRALMHQISARLGYVNRVAAGETRFLVEVADILNNLSEVFEVGYGDAELNKAFGDGWTKGTASPREQREILTELLLPADRFDSDAK